MREHRDVALFAGSVLLYAILLSAIAWGLPRTHYNPSDALIAIPVASVILSARGASWRRRLLYAGLVIGIFVIVDSAFLVSGLMHSAFEGLARLEPVVSVTAVAYMFFVQGFPLLILVLFVGRDPSVLWTKPSGTQQRAGRAKRKKR